MQSDPRTSLTRYEARVDTWVLTALGCASWPDFLKSLPGVYPSDALEALRRISRHGDLTVANQQIARSFIAASEANVVQPPYQPWRTGSRPLAVPHPLDFEWRFTPEAADVLLDRCVGAASGDAPVVLIGAPTVFIRAVERGKGHRFALFDKNRATVARLLSAYPRTQAFVHDACIDPPPCHVADVALLDPPWYDPHVRGFLWTAALSTRPGGTVFLSLPPVGTRPGISEERSALFEWTRSVGLDLVDLEEGQINYLSPPFEWNALRAEGIAGCPPDWRRGDLATFRVRWTGREEDRPAIPPEAEKWPEVEARGVRIRFAPHTPTPGVPPTLLTIVPGDVLPSVSARDKRRHAATVWTSGNRVFACSNPLQLRTDLRLALRMGDENEGDTHPARTAAVERLLDVILREEQEYAACRV